MEALFGLVSPEDCVDAPKKVVEQLTPFLGAALSGGYKIFQVDVYLVQGVPLQLGGEGGGPRPMFDDGLLGRLIC